MEGTSLVSILKSPTSAAVKQAAFTQHPRPAYYDREPDKKPKAMGYSVRTVHARYTEWRDPDSGKVLARELYDHTRDPHELRNIADQSPDAALIASTREALHRQFPLPRD